MKKAAAVILIFILLSAAFGAAFPAGAYFKNGDGVAFEETSETDGSGKPYLTVVGYLGYAKNVKIPESYKEMTVRYIKKESFSCNDYIASVSVPDTVAEIGEEAFSECVNLRSVTLPTSLVKLADKTFYGCRLLDYIILPGTLKEIGAAAFEGCSMLRSLKIPASVESIGAYAFMACENLILDCSENAYALSYAKSNNVFTDAADSPDYPLWQTIKFTLILGAAVLIINFTAKAVMRRYKKNKNNSKTV